MTVMEEKSEVNRRCMGMEGRSNVSRSVFVPRYFSTQFILSFYISVRSVEFACHQCQFQDFASLYGCDVSADVNHVPLNRASTFWC